MKFSFFPKLASTNLLTKTSPRPVLTRSESSSSSSRSLSSSCTSATDPDRDFFFSDDDDDDDAVLTPDTDNGSPPVYRVRFAEDQNQVYENRTMTTDQVKALWYTKSDYALFKRAVWDAVHAICTTDREASEKNQQSESSPSVGQALGEAYLAFCTVQSASDILSVMAVCRVPPSLDDVIGLDRLLVRAVIVDRMQRKRRLQRRITLAWRQQPQRQQHHHHHADGLRRHHDHHDDDDALLCARADHLRRLSRRESQPSRLYAHHVAQCAMRGEATTTTASCCWTEQTSHDDGVRGD